MYCFQRFVVLYLCATFCVEAKIYWADLEQTGSQLQDELSKYQKLTRLLENVRTNLLREKKEKEKLLIKFIAQKLEEQEWAKLTEVILEKLDNKIKNLEERKNNIVKQLNLMQKSLLFWKEKYSKEAYEHFLHLFPAKFQDSLIKSTMGPPFPLYKVRKKKSGMLFSPLQTQAIYSAAKGMVSYVGRLMPLGNVLIIRHWDNLYSVYVGAKKWNVIQGEWISKGRVIGIIEKNKKLYFELREKGQRIKTAEWFHPKILALGGL